MVRCGWIAKRARGQAVFYICHSQPIDVANLHSGQNGLFVSLVKTPFDGERDNRPLGRGNFHRLKIAGQRTTPQQLPLPDFPRGHVGAVWIMHRRLSEGNSRQSGEGDGEGELFQAKEHDEVRRMSQGKSSYMQLAHRNLGGPTWFVVSTGRGRPYCYCCPGGQYSPPCTPPCTFGVPIRSCRS